MKYIPNWQNQRKPCYFCGTYKSVKYTVETYELELSDEPFEVCACNKCALLEEAKNNEQIAFAEEREGEWKKVSDKYPRYVCTACNHLFNNKEYKFCPNCGAKMKR